jgi:tRNA(fMet)-specific endonuclease VapC
VAQPNYLLDTDICVVATRGKVDVSLRSRLYARLDAALGRLNLSTVTLFELQFGVAKAEQSYRASNLAAIAQLTDKVRVLPFDEDAAASAAKVRHMLANKQIGAYDLLIAGHALSRGLVVVTNNIAEFGRVAGLRVEEWLAP